MRWTRTEADTVPTEAEFAATLEVIRQLESKRCRWRHREEALSKFPGDGRPRRKPNLCRPLRRLPAAGTGRLSKHRNLMQAADEHQYRCRRRQSVAWDRC